MGRTLTPERMEKLPTAITYRKMGWTQQRIGEILVVPQTTISYWFSKNGTPDIVAKRNGINKNGTTDIVAKPQFLSWCGKVEDFNPDGIRFDLIIADPPWNMSKAKNELLAKRL